MFKNIPRSFISNAVGLLVATFLLEGFIVEMTIMAIVTISAILVLVDFVVKPIIKLISFPINAVTLGVFGWFINAILLFFVAYIVDGLEITGGNTNFDFLGPLSLTIPNIYLGMFMTLITASFIISFTKWLLNKLIF